MTKAILHLLAIVLMVFAFTYSAQADLKIATVNMKKFFESSQKVKKVEQQVAEVRAVFSKELVERAAVCQGIAREIQKIDKEFERLDLSANDRATLVAQRNQKAGDLLARELENGDFQAAREAQIKEQTTRLRTGAMEEINNAVTAAVKAGKFDIVFDPPTPSPGTAPASSKADDLTDQILSVLNEPE